MSADDTGFWSARPELNHVRRFARARLASPWATLGVVLARAAATVPPSVVLPPTVGTVASLNLLVAVVARSGGGKGAATGAARDAITYQDVNGIEIDVPVFPIGSGEGIARTFNPDADEPITRALFSVSEVDTLSALSARTGATIMPTLRQVFSGETLGHQNAQKATRIVVPEHTYRACVVVGVQEQRAGGLIDDVAGGTPQRFVWLPATDTGATTPPPPCPAGSTIKAPRWPSDQHTLVIPDQARDDITAWRHRDLLGHSDPRDGHLMLTRLKVAASLMVLGGRTIVSVEDWQLADMVMQVSLDTRNRIEATLAETATSANRARAVATADREEVIADRKVQRTASGIIAKLSKAMEPMTEGNLRRSLRSDQRPEFGPAMDLLIASGQAVKESGGYRATVHVDTLSTPHSGRSEHVDTSVHVDRPTVAPKPCGHPGKATANGKCGQCIAERNWGAA